MELQKVTLRFNQNTIKLSQSLFIGAKSFM